MRLVSYEAGRSWRCGVDTGFAVIDAATAMARAGVRDTVPTDARPVTTREVLGLGRDGLDELSSFIKTDWDVLHGAKLEIDQLRLGPPIWNPPKIICLGLNYRDHAKETGLEPPPSPIFFAKWANSLIGPYDSIRPPPTAAHQVDYEGELAIVIGKRGRQIAPEHALEHVAGAMAFNDVSARDLQNSSPTWMAGKAIDTFAPCGPALVLVDEIRDLQNLTIRTRVNGQTVQDGTTASMIFSVAEAIAHLSQLMTLEVGDIIATGTPAGVGLSRTPPLFLTADDVVEVEIDGIGTLRNLVGTCDVA